MENALTKPYHVNPSFSLEEWEKINAYLSATGGQSMRQYVRDAMLEKMHVDLNGMSEGERRAVETIIGINLAKITNLV